MFLLLLSGSIKGITFFLNNEFINEFQNYDLFLTEQTLHYSEKFLKK